MQLHLTDTGRHAARAAHRLDGFVERCRKRGLAVTPQRLAIIRALMSAMDHPRADRIYAAVRRQHPHISLATVHRTLETLCDIGEARKVTTLHDSARYDANLEPHHHIICVRCRRIRDVEVSGLDEAMGGRRELGGFELLGCSLEIRGLCENCAKREPRPSRTLRGAGPSNHKPPHAFTGGTGK